MWGAGGTTIDGAYPGSGHDRDWTSTNWASITYAANIRERASRLAAREKSSDPITMLKSSHFSKMLLAKERSEGIRSLPGNWADARIISWRVCSWIASEALACGRLAGAGAEAIFTINTVNFARRLSTQVTTKDPKFLGFDSTATSRKSFLNLNSLSMKVALTVNWATVQIGIEPDASVSHLLRKEKVLRTAFAWPSTLSDSGAFVTKLISTFADFWSALRRVEF